MSAHADRRRRIREWIAQERAANRLQKETVHHAADRCSLALGMAVKARELRQRWHDVMVAEARRRSAERARRLTT
jgi:hypothetical protein